LVFSPVLRNSGRTQSVLPEFRCFSATVVRKLKFPDNATFLHGAKYAKEKELYEYCDIQRVMPAGYAVLCSGLGLSDNLDYLQGTVHHMVCHFGVFIRACRVEHRKSDQKFAQGKLYRRVDQNGKNYIGPLVIRNDSVEQKHLPG
jgi:hypothetical protein